MMPFLNINADKLHFKCFEYPNEVKLTFVNVVHITKFVSVYTQTFRKGPFFSRALAHGKKCVFCNKITSISKAIVFSFLKSLLFLFY